MPLIPEKLRKKLFQFSSQAPPPAATNTVSFLTPPSPNPLQPLQPISSSSSAPPPGSLVLSLTHPDPSQSPATAFFLACVPDPCTFAYYSALVIHRHLTPAVGSSNTVRWRHPNIQLELEDKDGLAATSNGRIAISLHWVGSVMQDVQAGKRKIESAAQEFKGVGEFEI